MKSETEISFHCPKGPCNCSWHRWAQQSCRRRLKRLCGCCWQFKRQRPTCTTESPLIPPYVWTKTQPPRPNYGPLRQNRERAKENWESALTPLSLGQDPSLNATLLEAQVRIILAVFSLLPICMQELPGNNDVNSVVISKFLRPFVARLVRVHPILQTTFGYLRLELYGCKGNFVWLAVKWFYTLTDYPNFQSARKTEV